MSLAAVDTLARAALPCRDEHPENMRGPAVQASETLAAANVTVGHSILQPTLPGLPIPVPSEQRPKSHLNSKPRLPPRTAPPGQEEAEDELVTRYRACLISSGAAPKGQALYLWHIRAVSRIATRLVGRTMSWTDLMNDTMLLGRSLVYDRSLTHPQRQLSKWTLANRRSAVRDFVALLRAELTQLLGIDPTGIVDAALRSVAEPIGLGFRLTGGAPRHRGGDVPTAEEMGAIARAAAEVDGFRGLRNRAFFLILRQSGSRVNAVRALDGTQFIQMPDGSVRLYLPEKGKREFREVELSPVATETLMAYAAAFNRYAALRHWAARIRFGLPGPVWRNSSRSAWPYDDVRATLRAACERAGTMVVTPHAFRRAYATEAAASLPRHVVAQAGGWHGLERLDEHYVHPHMRITLDKIARCERVTAVGYEERML